MKLVNLPVPGAGNTIGPSFFRNLTRVCKALGTVKQFAVHVDPTPVQLLVGDPTPATNTYQIKLVSAGNLETEVFVWVKNAAAAIGQEIIKHFYTRAYAATPVPMAQIVTFAASMPDNYFLGGATSIDVNYSAGTGKVYKGMRFCKIDGETEITRFTLPKDTGEVFPYLGRPESFVAGGITPITLPLALTSSNVAGTVVRTVIPIKYRGKINEVLPAGSTGTARAASYYDVCAPTPATHFAVYDHADPLNVTLTIEARP